MGTSLQIDNEQLPPLVREYEALGELARRTHEELKAALAREGACWGTDEFGRNFESTYLPDQQHVLDSLDRTVDSIAEQGRLVTDLAHNLNDADAAGVTAIRTAMTDQDFPSSTLTPVTPTPSATPATTASPATERSPASFPAPDSTPTSAPTALDTDTTQAPSTTTTNSGETVPQTNSDRPPTSAPDTPGGPTPTTPSNIPGHTATTAPTTPSTTVAGTKPAGSTSTPASPAATGTAGTVNSAAGTRSGTPWGRSSTSTGAPANKVSAPATDPAPPRPPAPPPANSPRGNKRTERRQRAVPAAPQTARPADDNATVRANQLLAQALTTRHDMRVVGFAAPDIATTTLREIAKALDDVLTDHPYLVLDEFAIDDCGADITRLDWHRDSTAHPRFRRLTLHRTVAHKPDLYAEMVRAEVTSGRVTPASEDRPVYCAILRELGRALDILGGRHARRVAQRALIAEYLTLRGVDRYTDTLGSVVRGYRQWRGTTGGATPDGSFDPGTALVEAFVEMQLRPDEAGTPARTLQRLLVEAAKS